jgi:hypothetical protein
MLTVREVKKALSSLDDNTPVMCPSVVGYDECTVVRLIQVCFRGSYSEPGQWEKKANSSPADVARGAITVLVLE